MKKIIIALFLWMMFALPSGAFANIENNQIVVQIQNIEYDTMYHISYFPNGGSGLTLDERLYSSGDTAIVLDSLFERKGHSFIGWNT